MSLAQGATARVTASSESRRKGIFHETSRVVASRSILFFVGRYLSFWVSARKQDGQTHAHSGCGLLCWFIPERESIVYRGWTCNLVIRCWCFFAALSAANVSSPEMHTFLEWVVYCCIIWLLCRELRTDLAQRTSTKRFVSLQSGGNF